MASLLVLFIIFEFVSCSENRRDTVLDHINNGFKIAKDFLGSESVAMKVADFVVRAFQTNQKQPHFSGPGSSFSSEESREKYQNDINEAPQLMSPWRHLIKLFGLQTNQISAVAVNALIFIAQMITTFLSGPKQPSRQRSNDFSSYILEKNSKHLQNLIAAAKNESLPDSLEDLINEPQEDISCIKLLFCKITPFVSKMQQSVFGEKLPKTELRGSAVFYRHLPPQDKIEEKSDICERRYKECDLHE
ncbi:uncharacterized protein LOC110991374 [Pieris rapae]|uniref:uncharacterized protein LOC110991374 n=1 Tax=Pieris rapae TaxID=64459 RepID=UPI001E27AA03|nr:uncharacterized protein LOC110991374 [Pieris rapae]